MARTKEFDEETILNKAMELFQMKGYYATSAQDLVDSLEISRSSLYDTFGDKHSLFIQTLQHYRRHLTGSLMSIMDHSTDVEGCIKQIFQIAVSESVEDKISKGCFMVNSTIELGAQDPEVAEIVRGNMLDVEDALCRAVEKGQRQGLFSSAHSARSLARFLFNNISGIRVAARSGADKAVYDDIVAVTLAALK